MSTISPDIEHLVVVGGSLAGLRAAEGARLAGFTGDITLIGAETEEPYDRPSLSKQCLIEGVEAPGLQQLTEDEETEWNDLWLQVMS